MSTGFSPNFRTLQEVPVGQYDSAIGFLTGTEKYGKVIWEILHRRLPRRWGQTPPPLSVASWTRLQRQQKISAAVSAGITLLAIVTELVMLYWPSCKQQGNCPPTLLDLVYKEFYIYYCQKSPEEHLFCILWTRRRALCGICSITGEWPRFTERLFNRLIAKSA